LVKRKRSRRITLNRKRVKNILERIGESLKGVQYDLPSKATRVEIMRTKKSSIFFFDGEPLFVERENRMVPSLTNEAALSRLPSTVVDQGAIPFICNGADIMALGVKQIEGEFSPGQLVVIREERFHKALAIGSALVRSDEIETHTKGKVVENIHFVGDDAWQGYI